MEHAAHGHRIMSHPEPQLSNTLAAQVGARRRGVTSTQWSSNILSRHPTVTSTPELAEDDARQLTIIAE